MTSSGVAEASEVEEYLSQVKVNRSLFNAKGGGRWEGGSSGAQAGLEGRNLVFQEEKDVKEKGFLSKPPILVAF